MHIKLTSEAVHTKIRISQAVW